MTADLSVRDLMGRNVKTLNHNDKLTIADELMRMDRIRHLPVIDEGEELVGIVSQWDLFRSALARALGYGERGQQKLMDQLLVKEVMTKPVETIGPDAPVAEILLERAALFALAGVPRAIRHEKHKRGGAELPWNGLRTPRRRHLTHPSKGLGCAPENGFGTGSA